MTMLSSAPILLVDDEELNLTILREALGETFGPLVTARTGLEAIEQVKQHAPALVLMDIMMPGMNGYEACRAIKQSDFGQLTHVILVSAKASTPERVQGYEAGADDYITKPFEEEELLAKVRVQLRLRHALCELGRAQAVIAADNEKLEMLVEQRTKQLVETRDLVVFALAKLVDSRDPETGDHLERIRLYSRVLARQLSKEGPYTGRIDGAFIDGIYQSSPLHDIGKVGIPDVILLKPGRLSEAEFGIMKDHAVIGAQALAEMAGQRDGGGAFLKMAVEIARHHHERWDGSGYPDKLAGEAIPLAARIVAVADVFDALTSVRVYKAAYSVEVARSMITNESGKHFDPAVVEAFTKCYSEFVAIRRQYDGASKPAELAA
jgi:putative two-component system response regulator